MKRSARNNAPSTILEMISGHVNPTPPHLRGAGEPDRYDGGMLGDVAYIADRLRWAWDEAWEASSGGRSEPLTEDQLARQRADAEYTAAAKLDIGHGSPLAQNALRVATVNLAKCDELLDICCCACLPINVRGRRLPVIVTIGNGALGELLYACASIRWRLHFIDDHATTLRSPVAAAVLRTLKRANRNLLATRGPLEAAHRNATRDASITVDRLCVTCDRRVARKAGLECNTCEGYRRRHDGQPRPKDIDAA